MGRARRLPGHRSRGALADQSAAQLPGLLALEGERAPGVPGVATSHLRAFCGVGAARAKKDRHLRRARHGLHGSSGPGVSAHAQPESPTILPHLGGDHSCPSSPLCSTSTPHTGHFALACSARARPAASMSALKRTNTLSGSVSLNSCLIVTAGGGGGGAAAASEARRSTRYAGRLRSQASASDVRKPTRVCPNAMPLAAI